MTLKNFHRIFQNVIADTLKKFRVRFWFYNSFSFKLFSSIISNQFFRKSTFDSINDIDFFDLKVRSSSLLKSLKKSFDNTSRLSNSYHSLTRREFNRFIIHRFAIMKKNIKMIFLFEVTRLKDSFEYQTWQIEMRNQLIFMNFWHYVEIDELLNSIILIVEISIEKNLSVLVISSISEKIKKFKIDNLKTITIIRNRLCHGFVSIS